ncbi:MAG: hypothetical protein AAGC67_19330 [Myxococcota bacterium]
MSTAPVLSLVRHRVIDAIEEQAPRLEKASRRRIVLCCEEQQAQGWARRLSDAIFLAGKGAQVSDADVQEGLRYAVETHEIDEVLLVAHTECAHRAREERSSRIAAGSPGILWLHDRMAEHGQDLDAAKDQIRQGVGQLRWLLGDGIQLTGAVELGSSGQLLGYLEEDDDFRRIG